MRRTSAQLPEPAGRSVPPHLGIGTSALIGAFDSADERAVADVASVDERAEADVALAFAPLHKRAFGIATGVASALALLVFSVINVLHEPASRFPLGYLGQYFFGYTVSWPGALIGAAWGFVVGFVGGWFFAFCRNLALAITVFTIRTRAELTQTRDFLDHI